MFFVNFHYFCKHFNSFNLLVILKKIGIIFSFNANKGLYMLKKAVEMMGILAEQDLMYGANEEEQKNARRYAWTLHSRVLNSRLCSTQTD